MPAPHSPHSPRPTWRSTTSAGSPDPPAKAASPARSRPCPATRPAPTRTRTPHSATCWTCPRWWRTERRPVLMANWTWASGAISRERIEALAGLWNQALETFVRHASGDHGLTPSDVTVRHLSQDEIDEFELDFDEDEDESAW
ncbi:hypothetical protein NKH18_39960 [Streptomyces sp. M10(2022)]